MLSKNQEVRVLEGDYEGLIGRLESVTIDASGQSDGVVYLYAMRMFDNALIFVYKIEAVPDGFGMTHYHSTEYLEWMKKRHPKAE